jgi:hypothetical protein
MRKLIGSYLLLAVLVAMAVRPVELRAEIVLSFTKTPFEAFPCSMDFTQAVGSDAMTIVSVTAVDTRTSGNATAMLIGTPAPAITVDTDVVVFTVQGGVNGEVYQVSVKVQDSVTGFQYQGDELVTVNQS